MARARNRKPAPLSPMQTLAVAMACFAGARLGPNPVIWRIEQSADGAVTILCDGEAPGLCISPEDGGYCLVARETSGEQVRAGPFGSFDTALRAALRLLRERTREERETVSGNA